MSEIAVLIPCYNEEITIADVVGAFKQQLPAAKIYVYDNNSTDRTVERAAEAGAIVRKEPLQGKGNVVRRMFSEIDADTYVMVDGDGTYDASAVPDMLRKFQEENLDMLTGERVMHTSKAYPSGHIVGNKLFNLSIRLLFHSTFSDVFSGYRIFSRRFAKTFPSASKGFEIETELTVHALMMRLRSAEIPTRYFARPSGSVSKLSTCSDGIKITKMILDLILAERPLMIFLTVAALSFIVSMGLLIPILLTYATEGIVPKFPSLIVSMMLLTFATLNVFFGYLFEQIANQRRETRHLFYLQTSLCRQPAMECSKK